MENSQKAEREEMAKAQLAHDTKEPFLFDTCAGLCPSSERRLTRRKSERNHK